MKKLLFLLLSLTAVAAAQWRMPYEIKATSLSGGQIIDENNIWLSGASFSLFKSTDGGINWVKKFNADTTAYVATDLSFVNQTVGYAGGKYGIIYKTTDAGESWQRCPRPIADTTYDAVNIRFFDENNGIVMMTKKDAAIFYRTTNGAVSWDSVSAIKTTLSVGMLNMKFWDSNIGIAVEKGNNLYYTTNGGSTWIKSATPTYPSSITYSRTDQWGLIFLSATTAYSCGWGSSALGLQPTIFMKTTDAGATWTVLEQQEVNRTYINFKSMYFKDANNAFAVGGATYPGTVICRTTDGGVNWVPLPSFSGFTPNVVMGYNDVVILAGDGGNIIRSTDFGNTWTMINDHPSESMYSITTINDNIYSAGGSGVFYKSTNAGKDFKAQYMAVGNTCLRSNAMQFVNENVGYSVGQKKHALKTTDGGSTWFKVISDTLSNSIDNNAACFLNESTGFVVGRFGNNVDVIYKTTDGGVSWTTKTNQIFQELYNVGFANETQGAACGAKSAMLYTTDAGACWNNATLSAMDPTSIYSVKFYDGLNGIAAGNNVILKTTDGGANWTKTTDASFTYQLKGLFIKDATTFYAAGTKCVLLSTDAGATWTNILDTVWAKANSFTSINGVVVDKNGYIWIAALGGIATNAPIIDALHDGDIKSASFTLDQNYPNPFNPSTNIRFNLKETGTVSLKVYDVLGRGVKEIFNGSMSAGEHTLQLNGAGLASGTYIYSLKVNNHVISRKMTLIK